MKIMMSRKTPMLLTPTLPEVQLAAAKIGLPDLEAQKFYHYYSSNGWRVGRVKMVSFANALAGWKLRWQERQGGAGAVSPVMINGKPAPKDWRQKTIEDALKGL